MRSILTRQSSSYCAKRYSAALAPMNFLRGRFWYSSIWRSICACRRIAASARSARSRPLGCVAGVIDLGLALGGSRHAALRVARLGEQLCLLRLEAALAALRLGQVLARLAAAR